MTGEGFSSSPLRFKRDVDVETVGFTREIDLALLLLSPGVTEALSIVVDFCGAFENAVKILFYDQ